MNQALIVFSFFVAIFVSLVAFPEGPVAAGIAGILAGITLLVMKRVIKEEGEQEFLVGIFLAALNVRVILAVIIYSFQLEPYIGPDAQTYDYNGLNIIRCWTGVGLCENIVDDNFGMFYLVAVVYSLFGRNPLAVQFISAFCGALTAVLIYFCTYTIFANRRASKYSAIFVAFLPTMIIWSSQMLKDGLIIFALVVILTSIIRLQKQFSYFDIAILLFGLAGIMTLRFYLFYIVSLAAIGGFFLGQQLSLQSLIKRLVALVIIGIGLMFVGVYQIAERQSEVMSLERVQKVRTAFSDKRFAGSAIESDVDVSTPMGALMAMPMGIVTILMAPFPWQMLKMTQLLTLPDMIIWWLMLPLMYIGLKYTLKKRLRESISVLFFSLILLLAYSVYQGNLGTMYRQRAQIQVFLLVFAAVGLGVFQEKRENQMLNRRIQLNRKVTFP